jgi:hypothetical protein
LSHHFLFEVIKMDKLGDLFHLKKGSADAQLHEAVRTGDAKQVGKTLRRRSSAALIDSVDNDGRTPYVF